MTIEQEGIQVPADDPMVGGRIRDVMEQGMSESGDVRALKQLIEQDDVVMEIGGGIGFMSAFASKLVGDDRGFSYEANPAMRPASVVSTSRTA